jgi:hypothetical protein
VADAGAAAAPRARLRASSRRPVALGLSAGTPAAKRPH